jgi:hypothetical protein
VLTGTLVVRLLLPFHENTAKRQVKAPNVWGLVRKAAWQPARWTQNKTMASDDANGPGWFALLGETPVLLLESGDSSNPADRGAPMRPRLRSLRSRETRGQPLSGRRRWEDRVSRRSSANRAPALRR